MATQAIANNTDLDFPDLKGKGFKVHELPRSIKMPVVRGRRDFYKIGIGTGKMTLRYPDAVYEIDGTALFFVNPNATHSVVRHSKVVKGYACLFTEAFIGRERTEMLKNTSLHNTDISPVIHLGEAQAAFITGVFQKMLAVHDTTYEHRDELLKNCIELILHEALTLQPQQNTQHHKNAATRITHLFMDLLERQFPIEHYNDPLRLRTPQDFAAGLSVHINYLNRAIKETTGKPTSTHIAERITTEAKALLLYTDWNVADVAYSLGFEYPTYFNNYFKRVTGITPQSLRKAQV